MLTSWRLHFVPNAAYILYHRCAKSKSHVGTALAKPVVQSHNRSGVAQSVLHRHSTRLKCRFVGVDCCVGTTVRLAWPGSRRSSVIHPGWPAALVSCLVPLDTLTWLASGPASLFQMRLHRLDLVLDTLVVSRCGFPARPGWPPQFANPNFWDGPHKEAPAVIIARTRPAQAPPTRLLLPGGVCLALRYASRRSTPDSRVGGNTGAPACVQLPVDHVSAVCVLTNKLIDTRPVLMALEAPPLTVFARCMLPAMDGSMFPKSSTYSWQLVAGHRASACRATW